MGKWVHRLLDANLEAGTVVCAECGIVPGTRSASGSYGMQCGNVQRLRRLKRGHVPRKKSRTYKKLDHCEWPGCTSVIVDQCQLDVDHIDGDPTNNAISNFQTLCANCHRLKTWKIDMPGRRKA